MIDLVFMKKKHDLKLLVTLKNKSDEFDYIYDILIDTNSFHLNDGMYFFHNNKSNENHIKNILKENLDIDIKYPKIHSMLIGTVIDNDFTLHITALCTDCDSRKLKIKKIINNKK
jgi:hypothetical protein